LLRDAALANGCAVADAVVMTPAVLEEQGESLLSKIVPCVCCDVVQQ